MEQVGQRTGAVAQKQRDPVDLRGFLRLKRGQLRFGEAQVDMLAFEIEVVRQSALRPFGQNPGAFAQVVDVRAGHGKVALGTAQREIGLCHVAGEGQPRLIEKGALLGDVGIGRFDAASHLAPEVDFPRSVETALVERVGFPQQLGESVAVGPADLVEQARAGAEFTLALPWTVAVALTCGRPCEAVTSRWTRACAKWSAAVRKSGLAVKARRSSSSRTGSRNPCHQSGGSGAASASAGRKASDPLCQLVQSAGATAVGLW
jgi:hypothetical protein